MSRLYSDNCDYCKHCYDHENWSCDIEEPCEESEDKEMTRGEIIDGLELYTVVGLKKSPVHITVEELQKYIDKIKALKQEPFINKPCISSGVCKHDKNKVLNKIRAEIMKLQLYKMFEGEDTFYIERDDALAIIDKYKAESEE